MYGGFLLQIDDPVDSLMKSAIPIEKKCARFAPVDANLKTNRYIVTKLEKYGNASTTFVYPHHPPKVNNYATIFL